MLKNRVRRQQRGVRHPAAALATCAAAVGMIEGFVGPSGQPPPGGIQVVFAAGKCRLTPSTACGVVSVRGTDAAPLIFRAAGGEGTLLFDGATALDTAALAPVTNATVRALLNPAATTSVRALPVAAGGQKGGQMGAAGRLLGFRAPSFPVPLGFSTMLTGLTAPNRSQCEVQFTYEASRREPDALPTEPLWQASLILGRAVPRNCENIQQRKNPAWCSSHVRMLARAHDCTASHALPPPRFPWRISSHHAANEHPALRVLVRHQVLL